MREIKIVSKNFSVKDSHLLKTALKNGAYESIKEAFSKTPDEIIDIITQSKLRGKGGGGAYTGKKWCLMPKNPEKSFLVVNCDESEPGTFKDRYIISKDPHLLIEGIIISAYAIRAHDVYIYIRGEYYQFQKILQNAINEAYEKEIIGEKVMGHPYRIDITIHRGAGAYICGEKSALLESLEGKRGHPRLKPHSPQPEYLFGYPTVVNNVETIATVPYIIKNSAKGYLRYGTQNSPGTFLFALSGHINNPGVYECEYGVSMMEYIESFGGGIKGGKKLKAVIPGGASTPVLTADEVKKARLDYDSLKKFGSSLGTGGMIVMDEDTSMVKALKNLLDFYARESCGQCTPCREGTGWVRDIVASILNKEATMQDIKTLLDVSDTMNGKTICVFAPAVSGVINAFVNKFEDEFKSFLKSVK